jgi:hypothetical protein
MCTKKNEILSFAGKWMNVKVEEGQGHRYRGGGSIEGWVRNRKGQDDRCMFYACIEMPQ